MLLFFQSNFVEQNFGSGSTKLWLNLQKFVIIGIGRIFFVKTKNLYAQIAEKISKAGKELLPDFLKILNTLSFIRNPF